MELTDLVQYITHRHSGKVPCPVAIPHPWQAEPPLPARVTVDVSHHHPQGITAPAGWEIIQRKGLVWMVEHKSRDRGSTTWQYGMLPATCYVQEAASAPTTQFLVNTSTTCRAQNVADLEYYVHWSRQLLATIQWITGCELLIGASAVTYNPHFLYFSSPHLLHERQGAVTE
jgi:hypothetical protein